MNRTRTVVKEKEHGGAKCPPRQEFFDCNIHECPVDCAYEFTPWSPCTASCEGGLQSRDVIVHTNAAYDGQQCPDDSAPEQRVCNSFACPTLPPSFPPTREPTATPSASPTLAAYEPVVNVYGSDFVLYEATLNGSYHDAGASCSDLKEGDISARVVVSGAIFPQLTRTGTYKLSYDCENTLAMPAKKATKTIIVRDGTCPVCSMNSGPATVEASFPYIDAGVRCSDTLDGTIDDVVVSNPVDVERTGVYLVTYRARDATGNWNDGNCKHSKTYIRTVRVVDTLKPVLALHYNGKTIVHSATTKTVYPMYSGSRRLMEQMPSTYSLSMGLVFAASLLGCIGLFSVQSPARQTPEFLDV
jgi:hypothetical protein